MIKFGPVTIQREKTVNPWIAWTNNLPKYMSMVCTPDENAPYIRDGDRFSMDDDSIASSLTLFLSFVFNLASHYDIEIEVLCGKDAYMLFAEIAANGWQTYIQDDAACTPPQVMNATTVADPKVVDFKRKPKGDNAG